MKRVITTKEVMEALAEAVYEKGSDYNYKSEHMYCVNFEVLDNGDREPRCIAGHVYNKLGIDSLVSIGSSVRMAVEELSSGSISLEPTAIRALTVAQTIQDNGGTWGLAFDAAHAIYDTDERMSF